MLTVGGAISGYSAIGRPRWATAPAIVSSTESTVAKIGRSIKNFENMGDSSRPVTGQRAAQALAGYWAQVPERQVRQVPAAPLWAQSAGPQVQVAPASAADLGFVPD